MISIFDTEQRLASATELLDRVNLMAAGVRPPLSNEAINLLSAISERILADPFGRRSPQFVAVAYWMRRSALRQLVATSCSENKTADTLTVRSARGVVMHLPPTNVDTIFLYSWALSVLAGNCNIVRVPTQPDDATMWLVQLVCSVVSEFGQDKYQLFCTFPHDSDLLGHISARCDGRVIWGGDQKVLDVSRHPTRPDGLSLGFPDRTSIAVISTRSYLEANEDKRTQLIKGLYNDIFWFDQMGCGSPRIMFWVGDGNVSGACEDLEQRLANEAARKDYDVDTSVALQKINLAAGSLAEGDATQLRQHSNALHVLDAIDLGQLVKKKQGGGMLYNKAVLSLAEVASWADHSLQTVVHFGFASSELVEFARSLAGRGGFRLVPPGSALQFHPVWDGIDIIEHLTRRITIVSDS